MIKYLLLGFGILYASRAYAKRISKVRTASRVKNNEREKMLDSISE